MDPLYKNGLSTQSSTSDVRLNLVSLSDLIFIV